MEFGAGLKIEKLHGRKTFKTTEALPRIVEPGLALWLLMVKVCRPLDSLVVSTVNVPGASAPFATPSIWSVSKWTPTQESAVGNPTMPVTVVLGAGLRMEMQAARTVDREPPIVRASRRVTASNRLQPTVLTRDREDGIEDACIGKPPNTTVTAEMLRTLVPAT